MSNVHCIFGWLSVTEVLLLAVAVVLFREKVAACTLDVPVGSGRSKIVGIASGLSFFCQDIRIHSWCHS